MALARYLPRPWKLAIKARLAQARAWYATRFRSYGPAQLKQTLVKLGIRPGDAVMLHSAFAPEHGFRGSIGDLIDTFTDTVGPQGHLMMVSLPYRSASIDWLNSGKRFDVRKTPSMMGMVSEVFRRRPGVRRSLHPTHPVLVQGPDAERMTAAHPDQVHPCGPGTPFEALAQADGVIVFFNVDIAVVTFFHYLEHLVHHTLPFGLYTDEVYEVTVTDAEGQARTVRTHAFSREAIKRRLPNRLYDEMRAKGMLHTRRIGASVVLAVRARDFIATTLDLHQRGRPIYDLEGTAPVSPPAAP